MKCTPEFINSGLPYARLSFGIQLLAPRCLPGKDGPGKIQYTHTQVGAECFRVIRGKKFLQSYYVASDGTNYQESKSAHAFCGRCGVHILYAPSKNASTVEVNINCLDDDVHKVRMVSKTDTIAEGLPADSQWEEPLMPISEDLHSTSGFEFKMQNLYDDTRSTQSMFNKRSPYGAMNHGPPTPSTAGSVTDSYISSIGAGTRQLEQEAESMSVTSSVTNPASTVGRSFPQPFQTPTHASTSPIQPPHSDPRNITSPQTREQMLRYMKKHLASPSGGLSAMSPSQMTTPKAQRTSRR
uniref:CENP-V/GFA domain-containing protein n=1 Tax=Craspedostauros australis TaxID=1486917 RepID=A0A7R9ZRL7_9STRA|mmetsp:Transcript_7287/g.19718  ORF Transcript_7287/g.19718 Transcript_7287/m.19718 type:complete len:297 (+) Transcript_7287:654-1544(+)